MSEETFLLELYMNIEQALQRLFTLPNHKLILQGQPYWICIRSYTPSNRMLFEVSSNKNLPTDQRWSESQTQLLFDLGLKPRRQGYSIGKLFTLADADSLLELQALIDHICEMVFYVSASTLSLTLTESPPTQLYNRILVGQMKQLARSKEHQLRLQMYTTLIDATLLALVDGNGQLKKCDTIGNFDCFGAFTDEKHALQYDPRGLELTALPMLQIIKMAVEQNAGSLWLNPRGETRGELYKTELDGLWSRVKRLL